MKRLSILLLEALFPFLTLQSARGQDTLSRQLLQIALNQNITEIKTNEFLPGNITERIVQYPEENINLDSLKGKAIIFDFWNTYCTACIGALYKIQGLNEKFKDSIFIIPVTYQSKSSVEYFFSLRKKMGMQLLYPL